VIISACFNGRKGDRVLWKEYWFILWKI
jgi:hypothetical protein